MKKLIINVSTGSTITEDLTSDEQTAMNNDAVEAAKVQYKKERRIGIGITAGYTSIAEQLDQLYRDINAGKFGADAKTGEWFVGITSVKTGYPKPS